MKKKVLLNYWIDVIIFIAFILTGITGIIKMPILISKINMSFTVFNTISFIHDWSGMLMVIGCFVHIVLHWNWMKLMTKKIIFKGKNNGDKK